MGLRVCLVTPFAWSRPHDVNEHVAGVAQELRGLGHDVTVLAPSTRTADLIAGRRALLDGGSHELIALGPAVPVSRRSRIGVPVGVRANLSVALARGEYDVVHGFEPGLPSLSYLALRDARAFAVATFLSPERLGYPPGKAQRERLLGRIDALVATSERDRGGGRRAAARRLPRDHARGRPRALPARPQAKARRARVATGRAAADPRGRAGARIAARLGARLPAHETARRPARPAEGAARACVRADASRRGRASAIAERDVDLRPRAGRPRPRLARGSRGGSRDRLAARPGRAAGARSRRAAAAGRGRGLPRARGAGEPASAPSRRASRPPRASWTSSTGASPPDGDAPGRPSR